MSRLAQARAKPRLELDSREEKVTAFTESVAPESGQASQTPGGTQGSRPQSSNFANAPSINLPKGGGAVRGIGEKFGTNPSTGTGSTSIPLPFSPGRAGFTPELTLAYDSGSGNGPFGIGWSLSLPAISRKTDKGLPRYVEGERSDVFLLAGAEDLVPLLGGDSKPLRDQRTLGGTDFLVEQFRPRVEHQFTRIERWTEIATGLSHWRSISRDNVTNLYGTDSNSRIADPSPGASVRIFSWLIAQSFDDKGNAAIYEYAAEDDEGVDLSLASERNRVRSANRYLKRVKYGNLISRLVKPDLKDAEWLFELVLDYGEGHYRDLEPDGTVSEREQHCLAIAARDAAKPWQGRPDPFSSHRAGFEIRCHRRCLRALMFHHIPDLATGEKGYDGLVRSVEFDYSDLDLSNGVRTDEELAHEGSTRFGSFIGKMTQSAFERDNELDAEEAGGMVFPVYLKKSLPPLEFGYSRARIDDNVRDLDPRSLDNLPEGLDGDRYSWIDLHGEGVSGVLAEEAGAWFYKRNISPLQDAGAIRRAALGPLELVASKPSFPRGGGQGQFMDLAGDGQPDLVFLDSPTPGFFEHDSAEGWEGFRLFEKRLNRSLNDPNLRFMDLTGDGHVDVLVTEQDSLLWYESLGEEGFATAARTAQSQDEEKGPRIAFADREQAIFLADMCGDGLTDLVRIRNSEVCYWPNLGYGRFGAKRVLDNVRPFAPDSDFDHRRIRLADVDGSGTTDLVYLDGAGAILYFNQAGNRLSDGRRLAQFPPLDSLSSVTVADIMGNGTACLVWSTPLPCPASRRMRYIDLMGATKPHLLVRMRNNLGAETEVNYCSSTKFYLADKRDGRPWLTRLPFPVHVVERSITRDRISGNLFVTRYSYHHGYFDGAEREFRGFALVEQTDTEQFAALSAAGELMAATNVEQSSHVPPVLTKTWFHTGACFGGNRISKLFARLPGTADSYYREPGLGDAEAHALLLEDTLLPAGLSPDEEREACRALKGNMLREEIYALDGSDREPHPYRVTEQNFTIRPLQRRGPNQHAVFFAHPRETITYNYERNPTDPRTSHALTLTVDDFGNVLKSAAIAYGRRAPDPSLTPEEQDEQAALHAVAMNDRFTNAVGDADDYRSPLPAEATTFELIGLELGAGAVRLTFDDVAAAEAQAAEIAYEDEPAAGLLQKRVIERARTYYRSDDFTGPAPLGSVGALGLPFETYKLAFTPGLVEKIYGDKVNEAMFASEGRYVHTEGDSNWWVPSGRPFFSPDSGHSAGQELAYARDHFFLAKRYRDAFDSDAARTDTIIAYDQFDLLLEETRDPLGNRLTVGERDEDPDQPLVRRCQDYRVLQPALVMDANRNRSAVAFDVLGLVAGTAVMGKPGSNEGDKLDDFQANLTDRQVEDFFADPKGAAATTLLRDASTRIVYDIHAYWRSSAVGSADPGAVATIARERHSSDGPGPLQVGIIYSDGFGREIQKKAQAEPGPVPERDGAGAIVFDDNGRPAMSAVDAPVRWVASGWTVFNNKGKPVRQYEPFFTDLHRFEFEVRAGTSPILAYDPLQRVVATLHPNRAWEKAVYGTWRTETWDSNDTAGISDPALDPDVGGFFERLRGADYLPTWAGLRTDPAHASEFAARYPEPRERDDQQDAVAKALVHSETPTVAHSDSLGRVFVTVAHNRYKFSDSPTPAEDFLSARTVQDIENNKRRMFDSEGRLIATFDQDMLGNAVHATSIDFGERWNLADAAGKPLYAWDSRSQRTRNTYDLLHRKTGAFLSTDGAAEQMVWKAAYGESLADAADRNQLTRAVELRDQAGLVRNLAYDFKGNLLATSRTVATVYAETLDWSGQVALEEEDYVGSSRYDALNRPIQIIAPHLDDPNSKISIVQAGYNEATLLERIDAWPGSDSVPDGLLDPVTAPLRPVVGAAYDAKGQRLRIDYGNGVATSYSYDPETFRLVKLLTRRNPGGFPTDCPDPPDDQWPGCEVQSLNYCYDPVGNVTSVHDTAQQSVYFRNRRVDPDCFYTYDSVYRLIEATGREHLGQTGGEPLPFSYSDAARRRAHPADGRAMARYLERYSYDRAGNLTKMEHRGGDLLQPSWTRICDYLEAGLVDPDETGNRLTSSDWGAGHEQYGEGVGGFDAHGNMLRMPQLQQMEWDFSDRLKMTRRQAIDAADSEGSERQGERTFYVYGGDGKRIRKVTETAAGAIKEERLYLGSFELYRRNGLSPLVRETLHITDDKKRVALIETRTKGVEPGIPAELARYQFGNQIGSACLELDDQARIISYEEYSPYGSTTYQGTENAGQAPKRYRFSAKERDEESGLYYHGARYYAPWLCRWISCDPAGLADGLNPYLYAHANPVKFVDPTGLGGEEIGDFLTLLYHTAGFEAGKAKPPTFNPRSASPFGTQAHKEATAILEEIKKIFPEAERIYSEVRVENGVITKIAGKPGGPKGSHNLDIVVAKEGQTLKEGDTLTGGVAEMIGDLKYGGGVIDPKYAVHGSKLETITGRTVASAESALVNVPEVLKLDEGMSCVAATVETEGVVAKAVEATAAVSKLTRVAAPVIKVAAPVIKVVAPAARVAGKVAGPLGIAVGVYQMATAKNADEMIDGGITATSSALMMAPHPVAKAAGAGLFAGQLIDKGTGASGIAADAGVTVKNKLESWGANETFSYVAGGAVTVAAVPASITVGAVKKAGKGASWAYDKITDLVGYEFDF